MTMLKRVNYDLLYKRTDKKHSKLRKGIKKEEFKENDKTSGSTSLMFQISFSMND